jgi:hypothetical protein
MGGVATAVTQPIWVCREKDTSSVLRTVKNDCFCKVRRFLQTPRWPDWFTVTPRYQATK